MLKYLLSARDGSVVGLYTKSTRVCVGGRERHQEAIEGVRRAVDTSAAVQVPGREPKWKRRRVQRNKSVWSTELPDEIVAEDVLQLTVRTAAGWEGVLVKEVHRLGNVVY